MKSFVQTVVLLFVAAVLPAQIISTAETSGRGKTTYILAPNLSSYAGSRGNGGYIWLGHGLTDNFDFFTIDGWSTTGEATQFWLGLGSNTHFGKVAGVDVGLYDYVTMPVTRRREASTVFLNVALVASKHVGPVVPYLGANANVPLGHAAEQCVFTPPKTELNFPIGIAIPIGKYCFYGEVDAGRLRVYGVGISLTH